MKLRGNDEWDKKKVNIDRGTGYTNVSVVYYCHPVGDSLHIVTTI